MEEKHVCNPLGSEPLSPSVDQDSLDSMTDVPTSGTVREFVQCVWRLPFFPQTHKCRSTFHVEQPAALLVWAVRFF